MGTSEKLDQMLQNVPEVYHSGQLEVVKNAECLKGFESGASILLDDVSPVEHTMDVKVRGKNLLNYEDFDPTYTKNGISFTNNGDGTITASGTATVTTFYYFHPNIEFLGYYTLSGCPSGGSTTTYLMGFGGSNFADIGSGAIRNFPNKQKTNIFIKIFEGVTVENLVFKPQIELGTTSTAYTPYVTDLTAVKVRKCGKNLFDKNMPFDDSNRVSAEEGATFSYTYFIQLQPDTTYYCTVFNLYTDGSITLLSNKPKVNYSTNQAVLLAGSSGSAWKEQLALTTGDTGKLYIGTFVDHDKETHVNYKLSEWVQKCNLQIELGNTGTEYEPYISPTEYTPNADGTVGGVTSLHPNTTLMTDTEGVLIDCNYYKDISKTFDKLTTSVALSGGDS